MTSYLYRPECPLADKNGFVEKNNEYYYWLSLTTPDNRMMKGNQPVEFRFISDEMPPTVHMCNGKLYTSKKKFRDETRARGCVEIGNEKETVLKPRKPKKLSKKQRREDIKRALWEVKNNLHQPMR
jgi:hypothetical protein